MGNGNGEWAIGNDDAHINVLRYASHRLRYPSCGRGGRYARSELGADYQ